MNWIAFFILAYAVVALQAAIGAHVYLGLLIVIFIALGAARRSALLGAFVVGAMQDLAARQTLGLLAFSYGLVAFLVLDASRLVNRRHPLTHLFMALLGALIVLLIALLHSDLRHGPSPAFSVVIFTAIAAPLAIGILQRVQWLFAFHR